MKASYHGNAKPFVLALNAAADWDSVQPLLQELDARGLNLSYQKDLRVRRGVLRRACAVIAFLSARSMADSSFEEAILYAKSATVPIICVNLDHTPPNDSIKRMLYTSHMILADRYETPSQLVDRLMTADSLAHPALTKEQIRQARLMALALIAGAAFVIAAAGLFIWQQNESAKKTPATAVPTEEPLADIAGIQSSGMTEEDLLNIRMLIIAGDTMINPYQLLSYRSWDAVVSEIQQDGETIWSIEGKQLPRGTATDLSLIGRMSNLEKLILINQSAADISPLQSLTKLEYLELVDCPVESIEAISGLPMLNEVILDRTNVKSLAPLQTCGALTRFTGSIGQCTSIEGLANPKLHAITLFEAKQVTNLDALSACNELKDLAIYEAEKLNNISGISGCTSLETLLLDGALSVRSSAGLSGITTLKEVQLEDCGFTDLSGLKQSRGLQALLLQQVPVRDFSWTSGMNRLTNLQTFETGMNNFDFLNDLGVDSMELHFSGNIDDYSGLAAIPYYSFMHLNPRNGNVSAVLPYLESASIATLMLYDCIGIDLSALPKQVNHLYIVDGNLKSLEGLSAVTNVNTLTLESMDRLTSLKGLADCEKITNIAIRSCERLTDYEDLYQKSYASIELINLSTAPDLSRLQISNYGTLVFDTIPSITDISPLEACQSNIQLLSIRNMDTISGLSALKNMKVSKLEVTPQLEEQAKQLLDDYAINSYQIFYPTDELWAEEEQNFTLLSMEELDTLPDALLSRVLDFILIGDCIPDSETQDWKDQWDEKGQHFYIVDRQSQESTPVGAGVIDQVDRLAKLTKLQSLRLYDQPLTSLQGIQAFADLKYLEVRKSPLTDAAAAFTLTQLETLSLFNTQVSSIQGIQNLTKLKLIDLNSTKVTDLSPLNACDFDFAVENGGLYLDIAFIPCEDFSVVASIPVFSTLGVGGHDASLWLPYIEGKSIDTLRVNSTNLTNDQIAIIAGIPQLRELHVGWNEELTDLSPLLSCKTLEKLYINQDNSEAIASMEGKAQFTIEYN